MSRVHAYSQLIRLPNVFTAFADICLGLVTTWALAESMSSRRWWLAGGCLLAASACLYSAGMVWNDWFDLEQDLRERPFRPLPSERITTNTAARVGSGLFVAGMAFAALAGFHATVWDPTPLAVAAVLVAAILLYDGWLKRTWAGPVGMGSCRFLNVLLGLSVADEGLNWWGLHLASAVGVYVVGVTWLARTEARATRRSQLAAAAAVMSGSLVLALPLPLWFSPGTTSPLFVYLLVTTGFIVGWPIYQTILRPTPKSVQAAVKTAIFGLVVLDATLATALAGVIGLAILALLLPAVYLGRWVYST
jgi:4-hydroxybenzoate polyprenyltransferase